MTASFTVFVCSTFSDLSQEREGVLDAIRRLKLQHDSMEFFGARAEQPIETCLQEVRASDVLLVIVGHRYGSIVPDLGISYSEAEYAEGFRLKKPCLVYMRDDNVPILPKHMERDPEKLKLLERWKETIHSRHTVATFQDGGRLAVQVAADLARTIQELGEVAKARATARAEGGTALLTEVTSVLMDEIQEKIEDRIKEYIEFINLLPNNHKFKYPDPTYPFRRVESIKNIYLRLKDVKADNVKEFKKIIRDLKLFFGNYYHADLVNIYNQQLGEIQKKNDNDNADNWISNLNEFIYDYLDDETNALSQIISTSKEENELSSNNSMNKRKKIIFLCHANEDKHAVRELNSKLINEGFTTWFDENDILPGQNWDLEIKKALKNSEIVLIILSNNSVQKRGYIQKEIKLALDILDEIPEGEIFIIPVLLQEIKIPQRLKLHQVFNLFKDDLNKLFNALNYQLNKA